MEDNKVKYIYKKKQKENFFKQSKDLKEIASKIKDFFKNYLSYERKDQLESLFTPKNYIEIYNYFFLLKSNQEYIDIYSFINETLIELIKNKIKSEEENKNEIDKILNIINYIDIMDKKIKNIKNILTTCISRFNTELIKSMNEKLNVFSILTKTNNNFNEFVDNSENILLDNLSHMKEEELKEKIINSLNQFIKIIKIISNQKKIDSFFEKILELTIKNGKYINIYQEASNLLNQGCDKSEIHADIISNYFDSIYKEVEKDYIFFRRVFGEKEANKFKDKIIHIFIFDKFIKDIFKNQKLLKIMIFEEKYDILKFIELKTRHSLKLTKDYVDSIFGLLLSEYQSQIVLPQKTNIKEGISFIEQMILKIKALNNIFKEVFNQNRKVHLKYQETLLKLISSKNIETLEYFLSIYVNENIYNEKIRNNMILDRAFIQLLTNRNNKELFFNNHKKFIIKRISNNNFNLEVELSFQNFLKVNIENRYMTHVNRLFKDIEENKFINDNNSLNYFYLFSYEALDNQFDLLQIIDLSKESTNALNPFKSHMNKYNDRYPKRRINLSQILSSIEVVFLKKYNLLVNYVQWYILQTLLSQKGNNYSITYEKLISLIPYKPENRIFLKTYINSLIEMRILIKESKNEKNNDINLDDVIKINFNFEINTNNTIVCFSKPNSIIRGMIKKMNNIEKDKNEKEQDEYNRNYRTIAIKDNAKYIIDCVLIQIIKALPKGETIPEKNLIMFTIKHKLIMDLHLDKYRVVDTPFIKERISSLVERNLIQIHSNESNLTYSYV